MRIRDQLEKASDAFKLKAGALKVTASKRRHRGSNVGRRKSECQP